MIAAGRRQNRAWTCENPEGTCYGNTRTSNWSPATSTSCKTPVHLHEMKRQQTGLSHQRGRCRCLLLLGTLSSPQQLAVQTVNAYSECQTSSPHPTSLKTHNSHQTWKCHTSCGSCSALYKMFWSQCRCSCTSWVEMCIPTWVWWSFVWRSHVLNYL